MGYSIKPIKLTKLNMDLSNPRHPEQGSQQEIIQWMSGSHGDENVGKKLYVLAKDIADFGLNPSDIPIVVPATRGQFSVLEGNRRITALKLLTNPEMSPEKWVKKFRELASTAKELPTDVNCVIYEEPEEAFHFIEIKHLGQQEGKGTVPWGAEQNARHIERGKGRSRDRLALQLIETIRSEPTIPQKTKDLVNTGKFPITTLTRVLGDAEFLAFLGLDDIGDDLHFVIDPAEAFKPITKLVNDLGSKKIRVDDVKNKEKRRIYRTKFSSPEKADLTQASEPSPLSESAFSPAPEAKPTAKPKAGPVTPANRTTLIIRGTTLSIDSAKYKKEAAIFYELKNMPMDRKRGSTSNYYVIACAHLLRSFLELSAEAYINKHGLKPPGGGSWQQKHKLLDKLQATFAAVDNGSAVSTKFKKTAHKMLKSRDSIGNPNTLHDIVHSATTLPKPSDLKAVWDSYQPFLEILWNEMR